MQDQFGTSHGTVVMEHVRSVSKERPKIAFKRANRFAELA